MRAMGLLEPRLIDGPDGDFLDAMDRFTWSLGCDQLVCIDCQSCRDMESVEGTPASINVSFKGRSR